MKKRDDATKLGRPKIDPLASVPSNFRVNSENPKSVWIQFTDGSDLKLNASELSTSSDRCYITIRRGIVKRTITIPLSRISLLSKDEIPALEEKHAQNVSHETTGAALVPVTGLVPSDGIQRDPSNPDPEELKRRKAQMKLAIQNRGRDFIKKGEAVAPREDPKIQVSLADTI